jgi:hypothetical protein
MTTISTGRIFPPLLAGGRPAEELRCAAGAARWQRCAPSSSTRRLKNGSIVRNVEYLRFAGNRLSSVEVYFGLGPGEAPTNPAAWKAAQEGAQA